MALFFFIAGVLVGVAASHVAVPLWRSATTLVGHRSSAVRVSAAIASFALAAGILYLAIGSRHAPERPDMAGGAASGAASRGGTNQTAKSMDTAVAGLEARLAREGGTAADWSLLAQAYDVLGRPEDAKRARARAGTVAPAAPMAAGTGGAAPAAEVSGTVSLDKRFSDRVPPDATLFIYAKAADSPGPPLAVLRTTVGAWPVRFRLDDSMAMIPSRRLSQFDRVVIEARISRSGQATPASGDLYVTSGVLHPSTDIRLALVIDREIG